MITKLQLLGGISWKELDENTKGWMMKTQKAEENKHKRLDGITQKDDQKPTKGWMTTNQKML